MKQNYIRFELSDLPHVPWEIDLNDKGEVSSICCCWADTHSKISDIDYITDSQKLEMEEKVNALKL